MSSADGAYVSRENLTRADASSRRLARAVLTRGGRRRRQAGVRSRGVSILWGSDRVARSGGGLHDQVAGEADGSRGRGASSGRDGGVRRAGARRWSPRTVVAVVAFARTDDRTRAFVARAGARAEAVGGGARRRDVVTTFVRRTRFDTRSRCAYLTMCGIRSWRTRPAASVGATEAIARGGAGCGGARGQRVLPARTSPTRRSRGIIARWSRRR